MRSSEWNGGRQSMAVAWQPVPWLDVRAVSQVAHCGDAVAVAVLIAGA